MSRLNALDLVDDLCQIKMLSLFSSARDLSEYRERSRPYQSLLSTLRERYVWA